MQIKVTKQDIKGGIKLSASYCPIARAIRRTRRGHGEVCVRTGRGIIFLTDKLDRKHYIKCPLEVVKAARHFDATGEMKPFEFPLKMRG